MGNNYLYGTTATGGAGDFSRSATFVIAAYNSVDTTNADIVLNGLSPGTSDDVLIQEAINALPTSSLGSESSGGGGKILFLEGDYYPKAPIIISNSNVTLSGMNQASTMFHVPNNFNQDLFQVNVGGTKTIFNVIFEHFGVDGNVSHQTSGNIFKLVNSIQCFLDHLTILNVWGYCLWLDKANNQDNYNNWVKNCTFGGNVGGFVNEVNTETNIYVDNYMYGAVGFTGGAYPLALNGGGSHVINNQFGGNSNASNQNAYIRCGNTNPLKIIGNMFNNCSKQWIQLLGGGHSVIGNTFIGGGQLTNNTYNAIEVWDGNNIISGNNFAAFTNFNLNDIVEKNNIGNGNVITNNAIHTSLQFGVVTLNAYTEVRGNTNFPDNQTIVTKSTNYTITSLDYMVLASGTTTITLPTAVGIPGAVYVIKNTDASHTVTIATTSSQTIDGVTSKTLAAQYKYMTVISDGVNWNIIANN